VRHSRGGAAVWRRLEKEALTMLQDASDAGKPADKSLRDSIAGMAAWLRLFVEPGGVTEVRAVGVKAQYGRPYIESGYFDYEHLDKAAEEAARLTLKGKARAVYFSLNPTDKSLLARRANRAERAEEGELTADRHILRRRWLLVDADPDRDARISASDEEKVEALAVIRTLRDHLRDRGWPDPVLADSGNGYHLLYRIDLPADDGGLVERVLLALSQQFGSPKVKIDQAVAKPSQLTKLYGTVARKGDSVPELTRTHRGSHLLEVPGCAGPEDVSTADVRTVPAELLEALAAEAKEEPKATKPPVPAPSANGHGYQSRLLVERYLTDRGITYRVKDTPASGGRTVYLIPCPFDPSHTGGDCCIMQAPDGALSAHCFHASCSGQGWQQFKEKIGKPERHHYDPPLEGKKPRKKRVGPSGVRAEDAGGAPPPAGGEAPPAGGGPGAAGGQPVILVNDRQLPAITSDALDAVRAANVPPRLFQRGGVFTRVRTDRRTQALSLQVMDDAAVRGHIARVATWLRKTGEDVKAVPPPMDVVRDLCSLPEWEHVPPIHAVIETPAFAADGRLVCTPGYDPRSGLWYRPAPGLDIPPVPDSPSAGEIKEARDLLLLELLGDFPFDDGGDKGGDSSRANTLAALLLPFLRQMIDGPTPLHLFDAPTEGTGKTLLIQCLTTVAAGRAAAGMAESSCDEEWRKRITAALLKGSAFAFLDNLNRTLDSGALASVLTQTEWEDRLLGVSKNVVLPNTAVWLASGNNTRLSRELVRRSLWCRLDSRLERPWERPTEQWRHPRLAAWTRENRGRLVWAALTLCRAWIAAGRPAGQQTLGQFEAWAEVIGGVLDVAGVPGLLANANRFRAAAADKADEWREFVAAWWAKYTGDRVGVEGLYQLAAAEKLLDGVLGDKGERSQRTRMGVALGKMRGRVVGDHRVVAADEDHSGRRTYRLEAVKQDGGATPKEPPAEGEGGFEMEG
jgi:hypothetical protein